MTFHFDIENKTWTEKENIGIETLVPGKKLYWHRNKFQWKIKH